MSKMELDGYEKDWESGTVRGLDFGKIIVGTIIVAGLCYALHLFVVVPFGLTYKWNDITQIGIVVVIGSLIEVWLVLTSKKKYEDKDYEMDIGLGEKKKVVIKETPNIILDEVKENLVTLEYHLKNNSLEAAKDVYRDACERINLIPKESRDEVQTKCDEAKSKIDELEKKYKEGKAQV